MIVFEIRNKDDKRRLLGYLFYYERSRRFFAELLPGLDEWTAPLMFSSHAKKGILSIDSAWSAKFVNQRIVPPDRQNIGTILKENGLSSYDEYKLLCLSEGCCAQDGLFLVRIRENEIDASVRKRLDEKVLDVMPLSGNRALVFFKDKLSRIVDIGELCAEERAFGNVLRDKETFSNVKVSPGGNGIEWGEERFVSANTLREAGEESAVEYGDLLRFIKDRLADTAEVSKTLNCSRQYVKQLADKGRLTPVRDAAGTNTFMRAQLERE